MSSLLSPNDREALREQSSTKKKHSGDAVATKPQLRPRNDDKSGPPNPASGDTKGSKTKPIQQNG